jgi:rhodanese-related sulfurtransferase
MDPSGFIERIQAAGFTLAAQGGNLAVSPASRLSDSQRQFIKAHKSAILAALAEKPDAQPVPINTPITATEAPSGTFEDHPSHITELVRCCDCAHQKSTDHPALIVCAAGRESPAACGSWWKFDRRGCDRYQGTRSF